NRYILYALWIQIRFKRSYRIKRHYSIEVIAHLGILRNILGLIKLWVLFRYKGSSGYIEYTANSDCIKSYGLTSLCEWRAVTPEGKATAEVPARSGFCF